jgi:transcriptional regulator with XRE-family HTH domain
MSPLQLRLVAELRLAYRESGLTYLQIAARAEMGPNTVQRALNGGRVTVPSLLRLCYVLDREIRLAKANAVRGCVSA